MNNLREQESMTSEVREKLTVADVDCYMMKGGIEKSQ